VIAKSNVERADVSGKQESSRPCPPPPVRTIFQDIERDIRWLEIDDIKRRLQPLMVGYRIQTPVFDPGSFVYRARRLCPAFNKAKGITRQDLIYPPANITPLGRVNRPGQPVFYASLNKEAVFFELLELREGDEIVLTFWKTNERAIVNNIGYTEFAFKQLGARRELLRWDQSQSPSSTEATITLPTIPEEIVRSALSHDQNRALKEAFGEYFTHKVTPNVPLLYKLTTAIGEMHLGNIRHVKSVTTQFAGILYPSVRTWANGDNLALLPWFVDNHLEFRKAVHIKIKSRTDTQINIDQLDAAHEFNGSGQLIWLGRIRKWTLQPRQTARFTLVEGRDDNGDFLLSSDGKACHWTAEDESTKTPIEMD
jgi:RES domain